MRINVGQVDVNLTKGYAIKAGEKHNIRAKTLQVLRHLIDHHQQVVNKEILLSTIWQDVVVQDQVLVQSIKELRTLFGSEAIKTYPKQGYQWVAEYQPIEHRTGNNLLQRRLALSVLIGLLLVVAVFWLPTVKHEQNSPLKIAILPIENAIPDAVHSWIPTKGTQELKRLMAQHSDIAILNAEQLEQIKQQQAADVIVSTRLMGYPNDFQLDYTLYLPHGVERGVKFSDSIDDLFTQLVAELVQRFELDSSNPLPSALTSNDFSREALTRGIELYLERDYHAAIGFFQAALHSNDTLLAARRVLAASYINVEQQKLARQLLLNNIEHAQTLNNHKEQIRSQLMLAALLINWYQGAQYPEAIDHLNQVIALAKTHQQPIFAAYAYEELAKVQRIQEQFIAAEQSLNKALNLHQLIDNNYSQTATLIEFALLAARQNKTAESSQYLAQAQHIADQHGAATNHVAILMAQAQIAKNQTKIEQAQHFAEQAKAIAKKTDNLLLVARIDAWLDNRYYYEVH